MTIDSVVVRVGRETNLVLGPDRTICIGDTIQLAASGADYYLWSPSEGLSDPTSATPRAFPSQTTRYTLIGRSIDGCSSESSVTVSVAPRRQLTLRLAAADTLIVPGKKAHLVLQIPAGIGTVDVEIQVDPVTLGWDGSAVASNAWLVQASEATPGVLRISGAGLPAGASIRLGLDVYLPPDRRLSETPSLRLLSHSGGGCDSVTTTVQPMVYDPTCAWGIRGVTGTGSRFALSAGETQIDYTLGIDTPVELTLTDLVGSETTILPRTVLRAGAYAVPIPQGLASGIYFIRMITPVTSVVVKVVVR